MRPVVLLIIKHIFLQRFDPKHPKHHLKSKVQDDAYDGKNSEGKKKIPSASWRRGIPE